MGLFSRLRRQTGESDVVVEEGWPASAPSGFVVFDIETTGLSPKSDRIVELGLIRVDSAGNPLGYWSSLINPRGPVGATHIHGIKESDVEGAPTFEECVDEVLEKLQGQALVAHNAKFDHSFLQAELGRLGWHLPEIPVVCTMVESRNFLPGIERKRLVDCAQAIGIVREVEHRALGDASLTTAVFHFYLNGPTNKDRSMQLRTLPDYAKTVVWPSEPGEPTVISSPQPRAYRVSAPLRLSLLKAVSEVMPEDLLGDEATPAELSYGALLLDSLADGSISDAEIEALSECAASFDVSAISVGRIHQTLILNLAREAWRDGVVTRAETQEVVVCAQRLGLPDSTARACLKEVEDLRAARVEARSRELPSDWSHGEPLRVGDRIVITGCYQVGRDELETSARKLGIRVTGSVSGRTNLLVSDGTINGNKDADARRLGVRVVGPEEFRILLDFVQPATLPTGQPSNARPEEMPVQGPSSHDVVRQESLVCVTCGKTFLRVVTRGRKPHECEECRKN